MVVAWLVGSLMAWLAESYRRCTFANQMLARLAHEKELQEKWNHLEAQRKLVNELGTVREEVCHVLQCWAIALHFWVPVSKNR